MRPNLLATTGLLLAFAPGGSAESPAAGNIHEVSRSLPRAKVVPLDTVVTVGDISIRPIATPHAGLEHYSYRVEWLGRSLYFVGDTEDPAALLAQRGLDVAFVTSWLWRAVRARGETIDARRVIIYHHRSGETVPDCTGSCRVPRQGDRWEVEDGPIP